MNKPILANGTRSDLRSANSCARREGAARTEHTNRNTTPLNNFFKREPREADDHRVEGRRAELRDSPVNAGAANFHGPVDLSKLSYD
jgi:hypothetical protein